jgi:23S rRNA pseudouridine2604 synthase
MLVRLSKVMSDRGLASRREADKLIESGQVQVDGQVVNTLGVKVSPDCEIVILKQVSKVTIALNKPVGFVSTQPEKGYREAIELIRPENQVRGEGDPRFHPSMLRKLAVAGRLDIDSKGLLILTQSGVIAKKIIGENSEVEKEYLVRVNGGRPPLDRLREGLSLDGKKLKRAEVEEIKPGLLKFVLREGKKRQIRRMCELVGLEVVSLKRVRVGNILLGDLPEGKWRIIQRELLEK